MIEALFRESVRLFLRALFGSLGGVTVIGADRVPDRGRLLIAPNHISHLDPLLVGMAVRRPAWFMATDELFDVPVIGILAKWLRAFPIRQDSPDRRALRMAQSLLGHDEALVVFAEGHESLDGRLKPLQGGVIMLAMRTGAPVLPVGISGTHRMLPPREWRPRHGGAPVLIRFGRPIAAADLVGGLAGRAAIHAGLERLAEEIRVLSETGGAGSAFSDRET